MRFRLRPKGLLRRVSDWVERPGDTEGQLAARTIGAVAFIVGTPLTLLSAAIAHFTAMPGRFVLVLVGYALLLGTLGILLVVAKAPVAPLFTVAMVGNLAVSAWGTAEAGGIVQSGANALWAIVAPVLALLMFGIRAATFWFVAYMAVLVGSVFLVAEGPSADIEIRRRFASVLGGVSFFVFVIAAYFRTQRDDAQELADGLLSDVLPDEVVSRMKRGETTIADSFESVTVLFADIAEFTPMSAEMTAEELVELLNDVFSHFDRIADRHGLEKIKTIGDCYMAAAGVPIRVSDHADRVADMALEIRDSLEKEVFGGRSLRFRIGINSGPVTAGVIGETKFLYDLWGDTVNTASRMESHGIAGQIQVTEATRRLLEGRYRFGPRRVVEVKGKGEMEVSMLEGPQER